MPKRKITLIADLKNDNEGHVLAFFIAVVAMKYRGNANQISMNPWYGQINL
jgi:hypothetical protein